jgi:deoxyribodipyrimidine photolyase-related protein
LKALLLLGNQLFDPKILEKHNVEKDSLVFMREDPELCTYYKFHKHKIIFFLSAMREYSKELQEASYKVHYEKLNENIVSFEMALEAFIIKNKIQELTLFEIEDKFFETRVYNLLTKLKIKVRLLPSPMFITSRQRFSDYLKKSKKPFMKTFYEQQRKDFNILVDEDKKPVGGKWSFDDENRLSLAKDINPPALPFVKPSKTITEVSDITNKYFSGHPGSSTTFALPTERAGARKWLDVFLKERLESFGPYEDAINPRSEFVFHSFLTPFLNCGLLTPREVVAATLSYAKSNDIPIASLEGFIRQIIGWREFVRGIYQNYSTTQDTANFWQHKGKLSDHWYKATTGIPPLDNAIQKTIAHSYCHHIERLMVIGNLMLLLEVEPREAHRWFMEMFIDSSDWVMGPNVYGMTLFSDGGIFATKPYICGSNYYRKMGGYKQEEWCDAIDGLYWVFIEKHKAFFLKNPRLSMMARTVEKMDAEKKQRIYRAADELKKKLIV